MARFDLTDFERAVIEPLLPTKVRGVKRVDDRRVLTALGERGPVWWNEGARDMTRRLARDTPYAERYATVGDAE